MGDRGSIGVLRRAIAEVGLHVATIRIRRVVFQAVASADQHGAGDAEALRRLQRFVEDIARNAFLSPWLKASPTHPLRSIEHLIVRACRRAHRLLGLPFLLLTRRIGLRSALPAPPWLLPDPDLSAFCARSLPGTLPTTRRDIAALKTRLRALKHLFKASRGRARIPRSVRLAWP
ncbi:transposase [Roseomonas sp. KE2513]|nr:transposase [Roseomonas sp. KE2513]